MQDKDYKKLGFALMEAKEEIKKYINYEDGGSCNLDSPLVKLERVNPDKLRKLNEDFEVNVHSVRGSSWWKGFFYLGIPLSGQGFRRTKMAEVIRDVLERNGFQAAVYYCME